MIADGAADNYNFVQENRVRELKGIAKRDSLSTADTEEALKSRVKPVKHVLLSKVTRESDEEPLRPCEEIKLDFRQYFS